MKAITVKVSTIDGVKKFVSKAQFVDGKVLVSTLDNMYRVDGKSIMGMFSLDLTKPIVITFEEENNEEFETYLKSVAI